MVQVYKTAPVVITADDDQDSIAFAQRVIHARYQAVSDAIQANEALFHTQEELQQTQEDLRLAQWRVDDARRQGARAEARARCYAWAAWIFAGAVLMEAVLLWRAA